ncbi:hypothetical protein T4D_989 [Trichinella pseudospiralis]|uniref:Uncharacterized protein n=1 Tax=Trichinella pseudospiralis TaxID=6337 RepID=A0A0V1FPW9_TRIPS|nr:hypothetical protein T4D_989 [Trichinella pseudospiralis]
MCKTVHTIKEISGTSEHSLPLETDEETLKGKRKILCFSRHVVNVIVLPPTADDAGDEASDVEIAADDADKGFEPAGKLVIEEEIDEEG